MSRESKSKRNLLLALIIALATFGHAVYAASGKHMKFKRVPTQFIAALGDPSAVSGTGAESWGLWRVDPGPRGVWLNSFDQLVAADGVASARWEFDSADWWVDENGLLMEKPDFPVPPGNYLVTGDREVTTVLTIHPPNGDGIRHWELHNGAKLFDVTHLPCRTARYTPSEDNVPCSPENAPLSAFPVTPGGPMPPVQGCNKLDYSVLFVVGVEIN